jgi:hypothetical protein
MPAVGAADATVTKTAVLAVQGVPGVCPPTAGQLVKRADRTLSGAVGADAADTGCGGARTGHGVELVARLLLR